MKQCPFCLGKKGSTCHVNTGLDSSEHRREWIDCSQCGATGEITEHHHEHVIKARTKRKERVARGETMRDAADRLGISVAKLCAMETGRDYKGCEQ